MSAKVDSQITLPTPFGTCQALSFTGLKNNEEPLVLAFGDWKKKEAPKVRIHSECLTGDVFGSLRCDCGPQLQETMKNFSKTSGIIVYLRQEGRGIGLINKLRAYALQDGGLDTYEANTVLGFDKDQRKFDLAADMLKAIGIHNIRLVSNNPEKSTQLEQNGIRIIDRLSTGTFLCPDNRRYLEAKFNIGNHDGLKILERQGGQK